MLVLAVEQDQVWESLRRERWICKEEVELLETARSIGLNVHESLVMKSHGIKLVLVARRHVKQGLSRGGNVLHLELNCRFEVESLNECGLLEGLGIAHTLDFDTFRVGANAKLWVLTDTLLNDVRDVLE